MDYAITIFYWGLIGFAVSVFVGFGIAACLGWCARRDLEVIVEWKTPDVEQMRDEDFEALLKGR